MSSKDKNPKKLHEDEEESGSGQAGSGEQSGSGGQGGKIAFRDFIKSGDSLRDDQLSPEERKRLLAVHRDAHEARVEKQKEQREKYADLKNGKVPLQQYRDGLANSGMNAAYRAHPVLSQKAQFSGIDRQVNSLPTENLSEANQEQRNELELQYRLQHSLQHTPKFNPKPQMNR